MMINLNEQYKLHHAVWSTYDQIKIKIWDSAKEAGWKTRGAEHLCQLFVVTGSGYKEGMEKKWCCSTVYTIRLNMGEIRLNTDFFFIDELNQDDMETKHIHILEIYNSTPHCIKAEFDL